MVNAHVSAQPISRAALPAHAYLHTWLRARLECPLPGYTVTLCVHAAEEEAEAAEAGGVDAIVERAVQRMPPPEAQPEAAAAAPRLVEEFPDLAVGSAQVRTPGRLPLGLPAIGACDRP